jgi:hypothetical protein
MTLTTVNRLIGAGLVIPVLVGIWAITSSNPYMVILVVLVGAAISFALIFTGTLVGGVKIVRGSAQPRTRDLFFFAVGANAVLLAVATALVVFGGKGA